ncbi:MAG TPA: transcriptional repressor LexA [Dehalococcoidia bacterium]|nr:transcriptional repressor LexA [Dehalococcoidia bacterium]
MKKLSEKQDRMLSFLRDFLDEHDYPPSIRDIQAGCGISSTSVVDYNLKALESQGRIRRDREISRGIVLLDEHGQEANSRSVADATGTVLQLSILGTIAAGQPLPIPTDEGLTTRDTDETIAVTPDVLNGRHPDTLYALRVKGTSMIDALINDGDLVVMEPVNTVRDGEMAAVYLKEENEVTLKKFYRDGKRVRLQPMNQTMDPIYTAANNVEVQGRVVTAIRSL